VALQVLEENRWSAGISFAIAVFRDAVCDFRDFKNGIGFSLNALEFAGTVKRRDPLPQVVEGQRVPLWMTDDYKSTSLRRICADQPRPTSNGRESKLSS
jgi:hypothetical protein